MSRARRLSSTREDLLQGVVEYLAEGDLLSSWQWCLENRELLRLDFEILLEEGRRQPDGPLANRVFRDWHQLWTERLVASGLSSQEAEVEATLFIGGVVGLQLDLITTGDVDRTSRAFRDLMERRFVVARGGEHPTSRRAPATP